MSECCARVLKTLQGLVANWYSIEIIAEFAGLSVDDTQDALEALFDLGEIEVDEWEDGLRIRLRHKEEPLTEEQKALVERWMCLAYKMAMEKSERKWLTNEELAQHLCFELIGIVKMYDPKVSPNFLTYACPHLRGARMTWHAEQKHLRGYKRGKKYDHLPEKVHLDLSVDGDREEWESATLYEDTPEFELRDEILELMSDLTFEQAQAIILTEYYEMTGDEACEATGKSRPTLVKNKREGLKVLRGEKAAKEKAAKKSDTKYSSDFGHLMPKILLGITEQWPAKDIFAPQKKKKDRVKGPCPICKDKPLDRISYCLFCDRWGQDDRARTTPKMSFMKKTTVEMTKYRDKYR